MSTLAAVRSSPNRLGIVATGRAADAMAERILEIFLAHRRSPAGEVTRASPKEFPVQKEEILASVLLHEPVTFVLPGFPCKSPNPKKVLGHLPDAGERESLRFLNGLCELVAEFYEPGVGIVVCSDGHIFSDVVGVEDAVVDQYLHSLQAIAVEERLRHVSFFAFNDIQPEADYAALRDRIVNDFAPSVEQLRASVSTEESAAALYRGIVKFLVDDAHNFSGSRSMLQRECRQRAYQVLQRSQAWGAVVRRYFPRSARLSIHPQRQGAEKLGIRLLDAPSAWVTPWHAIPLRKPDGSLTLARRSEIPEDARLIISDGFPSHYQLEQSC